MEQTHLKPKVLFGKIIKGSLWSLKTWWSWFSARKLGTFPLTISGGIESWSTHNKAIAIYEKNGCQSITGSVCSCGECYPYGMWGYDEYDGCNCSACGIPSDHWLCYKHIAYDYKLERFVQVV